MNGSVFTIGLLLLLWPRAFLQLPLEGSTSGSAGSKLVAYNDSLKTVAENINKATEKSEALISKHMTAVDKDPGALITKEAMLKPIQSNSLQPQNATIVRYPKFSFSEYHLFQILGHDFWSPSLPTTVLPLFGSSSQHNPELELQVDIEHLPNKNNFQIDLEILCGPHATPIILRYIIPFTFYGVTFCEDVMPFKIQDVSSQWSKDNSHQKNYSLRLKIIRRNTARHDTERAFQETFKNHVKINFTFHNPEWKLKSNSLYLWNWDSVFNWRDEVAAGRKYPQYFLTTEATNLVQKLDLATSNSFDTIRIFEPNVISLLSAAPEYVRSYANLAMIMSADRYIERDCLDSRLKNSVWFTTHRVAMSKWSDKMLKVGQVDSNGVLTFSRYGLSEAMTWFKEGPVRMNFREGLKSNKLTICAGLELFHDYMRLRSFQTAKKIEVTELSYKTVGSVDDGCQIVGSSTRNVTLFARSGYNLIICPIVCANSEEPYLFYSGDLALKPESFRDESGFLNDTIWASTEGIYIRWRSDVTYEDEGEYRCTAGNKEVKFNVSVVSLPYFKTKMRDGRNLIGSLPVRILAMEGEGYSVSCTVHFTGIQAPTLVPVFHLRSDGPDGKWTQETSATFLAEANADPSCHAEISESSSVNSKTLTLAVRSVRRDGRPRRSLFDHRFACHAAAAKSDAMRYALDEYNLQSGADVHFVPRPGPESFETKISDCCLKQFCQASTEQCSIEVALKKQSLDFLTNIGVKIEADFMQRSAPFVSSSDASFDSKLAKATIKAPGSLSSMSEKQRADFLAVRIVFRFLHVTDASKEASFTVLRGNETKVAADKKCSQNSACLFSTDFDNQTSESMTLADIIRNQISRTSMTLPPWLPSEVQTAPVQPNRPVPGLTRPDQTGSGQNITRSD